MIIESLLVSTLKPIPRAVPLDHIRKPGAAYNSLRSPDLTWIELRF